MQSQVQSFWNRREWITSSVTFLVGAVLWLVSSLALANPLSRPCTALETVEAFSTLVPQGAIWKAEHQHPGRATVVPEYSALIGWINVATALPCATKTPATVEIRSFKVIEQDARGKERIVSQLRFDGSTALDSNLFPRCAKDSNGHPNQCLSKWFGETTGTGEANAASVNGQAYVIDVSQMPRRNFHGWLQPRIPATKGMRYVVEVEARVMGTARLQLGVDWWRDQSADYAGWDAECHKPDSAKKKAGQPANNCESWIGSWVGDTGGQWKTFRAPNGSQ